jgi:site-specific DNA-methyltransferase (adenine-specific)
MELNKIYFRDCFEAFAEISDESIDMVLTDPPYNYIDAKWDGKIDCQRLFKDLNRVVKPKGSIVITAALKFAVDLINANRKYFRYEWIWEKNAPTGFLNAKKQPLRIHELILVFSKKVAVYYPQGVASCAIKKRNACKDGGCYEYKPLSGAYIQTQKNYPRSVLKYKNSIPSKERLHPTQKPLDLFEYLIKTYTTEGEIVLDPFAGSGVTAAAALNTGRRFLCFENDEEFFRRALDRIQTRR